MMSVETSYDENKMLEYIEKAVKLSLDDSLLSKFIEAEPLSFIKTKSSPKKILMTRKIMESISYGKINKYINKTYKVNIAFIEQQDEYGFIKTSICTSNKTKKKYQMFHIQRIFWYKKPDEYDILFS